MTNRPNLFVIGATKCGATVMCDFLGMHPDIAVAPAREINYFSLHIDKGEEWYLQQFQQDREAKYTVDASPTYFDTCNSVQIPKRIKKFSPACKLLILIRDPIERLISHFNYMQKIDQGPLLNGTSLEEFMNRDWPIVEAGVSRDEHLLTKLLTYSSYYGKIEFFSNVIGAENVLLIHYDDLRHDGQAVMDTVFDFLALPRIESNAFNEQHYLGQTARRQVSLEQEISLYRLFGYDYIQSCNVGVHRYRAPAGKRRDNEPVGAIYNGVAVGEDGWLFLVDGSNSVLDFFLCEAASTYPLVDEWVKRVRTRADRLRALGADFIQMFVPEKLTVYHHKLPWRIDWRQSPGRLFAQRCPADLRPHMLNLFDIFNAERDKLQLFIKSDSHWSHMGVFLAYQMLCAKLNIPFDAELLKRPSSTGPLVLDLGAKLPHPLKENCTFFQFVENAKLVEEGELVKFKRKTGRLNDGGLHIGSYVRYENESAPAKKRVVLFGDSFSEYREHLLTGLLAETFAEFAFVWSTSLDYGFIEAYKPDLVISEMTERYMRRVPDDNFDLARYVGDLMAKLPADAHSEA
jgi:alginate O-acetyltransferase complex protein AlgJ